MKFFCFRAPFMEIEPLLKISLFTDVDNVI